MVSLPSIPVSAEPLPDTPSSPARESQGGGGSKLTQLFQPRRTLDYVPKSRGDTDPNCRGRGYQVPHSRLLIAGESPLLRESHRWPESSIAGSQSLEASYRKGTARAPTPRAADEVLERPMWRLRRMKEAEARGEAPMPIAHEQIMAVLNRIKAKHSHDN